MVTTDNTLTASKRTKIVATVGHQTASLDVLERMIRAGMDVARLNMSHGTPAAHIEAAALIRTAAERAGREVGLLWDLPGPKNRLGELHGDVDLVPGARVVLTERPVEGDARRLPVSLEGFAGLVEPGHRVYLADGTVRLRAVEVGDDEVVAVVDVGGRVSSRKGVNLPDISVPIMGAVDKDLGLLDAALGSGSGVDWIAISFVSRAEDVDAFVGHLRARGEPTKVMAKIETAQGVANADAILRKADGLMVARGDLGSEVEPWDVPQLQRRLLQLAWEHGKPSIVATQLASSMINAPVGTRAEATDAATAIFQKSGALMLSEETAVGRFPVEAVAWLARNACATEPDLPYGEWLRERKPDHRYGPITRAVTSAAAEWGAKVIVAYTLTGSNAGLLASLHPRAKVLVLSPDPAVVRAASLLWGVTARQVALTPPFDHGDLVGTAEQAVVAAGLGQVGDRIVIHAGWTFGEPSSIIEVGELRAAVRHGHRGSDG